MRNRMFKYFKKLLFSIILAGISYSAFSISIPFKWKEIKATDYYILEFTNDSSFNDITTIYTPKENKITIEVKEPGTYYLKITPVNNSGSNGQPSEILSIKTDSEGNISYSDGKEKYTDLEDAEAIEIALGGSKVKDESEESDEDEKKTDTKTPVTNTIKSHPLQDKEKITLEDLDEHLNLDGFKK